MFRHRWNRPYYARTKGAEYLPLQRCALCGAKRNPLNASLVRKGDGQCWNAQVGAPSLDEAAVWREWLVSELRVVEASGEIVLWDHGSRRKTADEIPTLFEAAASP